MDINAYLEPLVAAHGGAVMRLLHGVLHHQEEAEDAYQDTWYAVWQARGRLRGGENPWPFIRKTALRKALDRLRRPRVASSLDAESAATTSTAAVDTDGRPDLSVLPARERACLVLFFWEGLSIREIAATLDVPDGTVKTWMFRGRDRLRQALLQRKEAP